MKDSSRIKHIIFIALISGMFFIPFLGAVHLFDWDEINFAEAAREMIITGDYHTVQIDYEPFMEKPPLFIWMQAASMKVFGVNEMAARLPNAIMGIVTLLILFMLGSHIHNARFGLIWALTYGGSLLPHFYFKSGLIDPTFNLFIFLGIAFMYSYQLRNKITFLIAAGIMAGGAVLTKGPVGLLILGMVTFIGALFLGNRIRLIFVGIPAIAIITILVSLLWYWPDLSRQGLPFLNEFVNYQLRLLTTQDAGHGGPFYYHFAVLLAGCFPASILIFSKLPYQRKMQDDLPYKWNIWMLVSLSVILFIFTIVQTKIIHYSSFAYFPISYLAATVLHLKIIKRQSLSGFQKFWFILLGSSLAVAFIMAPIIGMHPEWIIPYIKDQFAVANFQADVTWSFVDLLPGLFFLSILIGFYIMIKKQIMFRSIMVLFGGTAITIFLITWLFVPRIERYSQGAAIEFYESLQGKNVYVDVLGFKSYAHIFYSRKTVDQSDHVTTDWLLHGDIDRPAFFVCKNIHSDRFLDIPGLEEISRKNGFVFLKREPMSD